MLDLAAGRTRSASFGRTQGDLNARDELQVVEESRRVTVAREGTLRRPEPPAEVGQTVIVQQVDAHLTLLAWRWGGRDMTARDSRRHGGFEIGGRFTDVRRTPSSWTVVLGDHEIEIQ